jgi:ribosome-associated heat shock protein Hsp15
MMDKVRVDKYLWSVRIFKTRSVSAEACAKDKVIMNGDPVKASRMVREGDVINVRFGPFTRVFKVLVPIEKRQPARLVTEFMEELTSDEEIGRMKAHAAARAAWRTPGMGRPTKKERRDLDDFLTFDDW